MVFFFLDYFYFGGIKYIYFYNSMVMFYYFYYLLRFVFYLEILYVIFCWIEDDGLVRWFCVYGLEEEDYELFNLGL